jgi:subtilisin family serine protease
MFRRRAALFVVAIALLSAVPLSTQGQAPPGRAETTAAQIQQRLWDLAARHGDVRVLVQVRPDVAVAAEGRLPNRAAMLRQRDAIAAAQGKVLAKLPTGGHRIIHRYVTVPYVALQLNPAGLAALENGDGDIVRVMEDSIVKPVLSGSVPLIQADQAWGAGDDGDGTVVAVLDSGVDSTHPFLTGKVIEEACYSSTVAGVSQSLCPNGLDEQVGAGAAAPCALNSCTHGTHVAGIAAGNGATAGQTFSGVAKSAQIMAVQVFSEVIDAETCGGTAPCMGGFTSDIIAALEHVYSVALAGQNIVAVNMSLGGGSFAAPCDDEPYKPSIDHLRAIGIASVVASGNSFDPVSIGSPACVSSAISVGSTTKADKVSWFSNISPFVSLLAPGDSINSSVPGGGYEVMSGTSMAAPHVAGAWAAIRQGAPGASVTAVLNALRQTGVPITDDRLWASGTTTIPRIRIFQALASLTSVTSPTPSITDVSPSRVRAGGAAVLTITGSGFNVLSTVQWNGTAVPTTIVNTTKLQASIPAAEISVGTSTVSVLNPAPGGGSSNSLPVVVDPAAILAADATVVGPGASVTVTLSNGYGGEKDWLALAATSAADRSYLKWTYVGAGITSRTWTVTMPTTGGTYEFRLFLNNGYTRVATSIPPVTVDPSIYPAPTATALSPTKAIAGDAAFTITVTGTGFVAASSVRWNGSPRTTTLVSSTKLTAAITAGDVASAGTAQVTVFNPGPAGGTSSLLAFPIYPRPVLTISAATVDGGAQETVTLTGGLGGAKDWLALASTTAPNTSYPQWIYVGSGVTNKTWTVTMPSTPGSYEFRLFLDGSYVRVATSPVVTVRPYPVPVLTSLSPAATAAGAATFTLTATGSGFVSASVIQWNGQNRTTTFVSSTQLRTSIPSTDVAAIGTAQVTVSTPAPGGGTSAAQTFSINPPPSLTVSAASVAPGANVTTTLTNGLGGAKDWIALASTTAANTSYLQWVYVGSGMTSRTWTVTMPTTPGTYEFRLFLNNGYTRLATSPPVTVAAP